MFTQIQLLVYDMNRLRKTRNPFKRLLSRYIHHSLKKSIKPLCYNKVLNLEYLEELMEFITINSNNIFYYKDLGKEKLISLVYYNNEIVDIFIRPESYQQLLINYYPNGDRYKGRFMKLFKDEISINSAHVADETCTIVEKIIRESIERLLNEYIERG